MKKNCSLTFAGQAGFIIENTKGYKVGIDLYLSDCCDRYFGFKRLMPYLFNPLELDLDLIIATHAHYDHFDRDSIPLILSNSKTKLLCSSDCIPETKGMDISNDIITVLTKNELFTNDEISIKAMPCDHGPDTPDALGLLISIDGKKIYITGDTCYREDYLRSAELENIDVMIMPINGAFGNLNEREAASAVNIVNPKLAIPCHYWNFAQHGGNPYIFMNEMKEKNNDNYVLMRIGEKITI